MSRQTSRTSSSIFFKSEGATQGLHAEPEGWSLAAGSCRVEKHHNKEKSHSGVFFLSEFLDEEFNIFSGSKQQIYEL